MLSYNRHCGFSYCPFASTASQDSAAMQLESTGNNGCSVVHWVGGRRRKWGRQKRVKGCMGTERDWYCVRGRELKKKKKERHRKSERDTGELEREGAAASLQSGSWPPSSSAEHSLALGEEERVETLLRPFIGSHSSAGGCGSGIGTNISGKQLSPVGERHVQIARVTTEQTCCSAFSPFSQHYRTREDLK